MRDHFFKSFFRRSSAQAGGFTLIEIAFVLMIASLLFTGLIQVYRVELVKDRRLAVIAKMERIKAALLEFKTRTGFYPCPAGLRLLPSNPNNGRQDIQPPLNCKMSTPAVGGSLRYTNPISLNTMRLGAVPFKDLDLTAEDAIDPWGMRFVYGAAEDLAGTIPYDAAKGAITILDPAGVTSGSMPDRMPFVLLSMGPDKAGAWTPRGKIYGALPCPALGTSPEAHNCTADTVFQEGIYSESDNIALRYDDYLAYSLDSIAKGNGPPDFQEFNAVGSFPWVRPTDMGSRALVEAECWGGGGGGASGVGVWQSGGGGGGYAKVRIPLSDFNPPGNIIVGAGGASSAMLAGSDGGDSVIPGVMQASGGGGGLAAMGSGGGGFALGGTVGVFIDTGGNGGVGSGGPAGGFYTTISGNGGSVGFWGSPGRCTITVYDGH